MFFTITRLGFAALAPAMVFGQQLTTYSFTISGTLQTIVIPSPKVFATTTIHVTDPAFTVTSLVPGSVETRTYTVTGPAAELSSPPSLPSAVGYVSAVSGSPGPFAPVVVHGFSTSIQLPATVSVPTEPTKLAPVNLVVPTSASVASEASVSVAKVSNPAESAAKQESLVASDVAGSATSEATSVASEASSVPASTKSEAVSTAASASSAPVDSHSSVEFSSSGPPQAITGAIVATKSGETILTATSSLLSSETTTSQPTSAASTTNTNIGGSGSTPSSTTLTNVPAAPSSTSAKAPSSSSTSAPTSGGSPLRNVFETGSVLIAALIAAALLT